MTPALTRNRILPAALVSALLFSTALNQSACKAIVLDPASSAYEESKALLMLDESYLASLTERVNGTFFSDDIEVVQMNTSGGELISFSQHTVPLLASSASASTNDIKSDAKIAGNSKSPKVSIAKNLDLASSSSVAAKAYKKFYNSGGTQNHNAWTSKEAMSLGKNDVFTGLYYSAIATMCEKEFFVRAQTRPSYIGMPAELEGLSDNGMAILRTWLRGLYKKSNVGLLSEWLPGYPGIEIETPLDELGAIEISIENIYHVSGNYYIVSALAFYGEMKCFGYDIGVEQKGSNTWVVHFISEMWNSYDE